MPHPTPDADRCEWCVPLDAQHLYECQVPQPTSERGPLRITCTRPVGHRGEHIACGVALHDLARWPNDDSSPAAERGGESRER